MSFFLRSARLPFAHHVELRGARQFSVSGVARAAQGYGDGKGDPVGGDPQAQGSSNTTKQNAEHPGPAPPAEGEGTGGGPTKG